MFNFFKKKPKPDAVNLDPNSIWNQPGSQTFFYVFKSPKTGRPELRLGGQTETHFDLLINQEHGPHIFPDDRWKNLQPGSVGKSPANKPWTTLWQAE